MISSIKENELIPLAELYKAFSDPTRLRILLALSEGERCVGDIAEYLSMTDSAISHQLKALRQVKLVKGIRRGKLIYYSLDDDHILTMLNQGMEHIRE